jgi:serine/threonine protein kinase
MTVSMGKSASEETFGRYRLLDRLGEGGMAEVFKAKSFGVEGFEKILCIKRILPMLSEHERFVELFVHEAKLAVRLSHANIVQVFDLGRVEHADGTAPSYFIAMEYVPGLDLSTLLARCAKTTVAIPCAMATFIAAEIAKALDHAHRRRDEQARPLGIVHRDVSPQNILISWEGEVKVTDFGIAKARDSIPDDAEDPRPGRVRGKLAYMSPEQSRGGALDGRSDLFSLGVVLYEILAGSHPFRAPMPAETLRRIQASEYPPLSLLRPDAPEALVRIVDRLLAKDPRDRFEDAAKLHETLLGYFYGSGERFSANALAEFLTPFQSAAAPSDLGPGDVFDAEPSMSNERTPVEVPHPNAAAGTTTSQRGATDAPDGPSPTLGRERREVTALVLDLDRRDSRDAVVVRARDVLARHGAVIHEEQEASQLAAIFGLGDADGRDSEAAVRAALAVLRASASAVSAGVHVAPILIDADGAAVRDERLSALLRVAQALARATDDRVAVSSAVSRIVRSIFATEPLSMVGQILSYPAHVVTTTRPEVLHGRFVGRQAELRQLGTILAQATRKRAQLITLVGDKGIGKSRLLLEMGRRLHMGQHDVGYYVATCPKNGADAPWSGLTAMLAVLCGVDEGADERRIEEVLPRLRALGLQDDECSLLLGQLGTSLPQTMTPAVGSDGALSAAFARMVGRLSEDRLHCFVWDDAQSMDAATREAIVAIQSRPVTSTALRAVFLFATRDPELSLGEASEPHVVRLDELSDEDAARLIATRVDAHLLPPELLDFCHERAGGHPLFLGELVKELIDSGAVSSIDGAMHVRLERATTIPRTLRTLIAARVARLAPDERATLQRAAILGEPVPMELLARMQRAPDEAPSPEDRSIVLARELTSLTAQGFLRPLGPTRIGFASPMHAEIVLDAMPPEARRELHARAASAYRGVAGGDEVEHAAAIANHLHQAGDRSGSAAYYARDGMDRLRSHQPEQAIRSCLRALDVVDHESAAASELIGMLEPLALAASRVRVASDLPDVAARALRRIDAVGSLEQRVLARVHVARALGSCHHFELAFAQLDEANVLTAAEPGELRRQALVAELETANRCGDFARGVRVADELEAAWAIDDARVLLAVAWARAATGATSVALAALDRASLLTSSEDVVAASEREKQRVLVHIYSRDFRAAVAASATAVDLARSAGLRFELAASLHNLGDAARRLGDLPRAYASTSESRELAEASGHERLACLNRVHLAYLDALNGDPAADGKIQELVRYAESRDYFSDALEGRCLFAAILRHRGRREEARQELQAVGRLANAYGNRLIADDVREALTALDSLAVGP